MTNNWQTYRKTGNKGELLFSKNFQMNDLNKDSSLWTLDTNITQIRLSVDFMHAKKFFRYLHTNKLNLNKHVDIPLIVSCVELKIIIRLNRTQVVYLHIYNMSHVPPNPEFMLEKVQKGDFLKKGSRELIFFCFRFLWISHRPGMLN